MFCNNCGAEQSDASPRFCFRCGVGIPAKVDQPTNPSNTTDAVTTGITAPGKLRITALIATVALTALVFYAIVSSDTQKNETPASVVTPTPQKQEPPLANVTLHPYELLQNPYAYRSQMVVLTMMERPVLYNGSVIQYADIGGADPRVASQLGLMALRLNRMMSEDTALYDVLGVNAGLHSSDAEMLGQLAVIVPEGRSPLELGRYWEVEPLGALQGTNGFGAPIQVPQVRFWRYTDERYQKNSGVER